MVAILARNIEMDAVQDLLGMVGNVDDDAVADVRVSIRHREGGRHGTGNAPVADIGKEGDSEIGYHAEEDENKQRFHGGGGCIVTAEVFIGQSKYSA